jgi:isopentenyl-diphosphate delta-isomerase
MNDKKYPIVNSKDEIIEYTGKEESYQKKQMLRSVQIFVYNSKGEIYVQKRSKNKIRYPGYFCASAAGHVEPGEDYRQAAIRELKEELKLEQTEGLNFIIKEKTPVGNNNYAMMAFFTVITDEPPHPDKKEVDGGRFYSAENVEKMISKGIPFTPSFLHFFQKINKSNK